MLTRSEQRAAELSSLGLRPVVGDLTESFDMPAVAHLDSVLFAVGFDRTAGQSIEEVYVGGLQRVVGALAIPVDRFVYISSTGVYGQSGGEWVDEDSPADPPRAGGRACLAAEQLLATSPLGPSAIVLRLAGIYGPGRIPKRDAVAAGVALPARADSMLNLIHVDDAVATVLAAERQAKPPRRYLVSDGSPVRREEFYAQLAKLIGAPSPRFDSPRSGTAGSPRDLSDKRICNGRMLRELQVALRYPSFRDGLSALVKDAK